MAARGCAAAAALSSDARHPGPRFAAWRATRLAWLALGLAGLAQADAALASARVRGSTLEYVAPTGTREQCIALEHMPGGAYTDADLAEERRLCGIDFHGKTHGLCPKVFSTSPGTLIYDLAGGPHAGRREAFEREACGGGVRKEAAGGEPVSYKMSVNTRESSATFANAALAYYHFARYFHASVHVPVAVFRSVDRTEHARRVSARGVELSAGRANLRMNHAAWTALLAAERDPDSYKPQEEIFTPDGLVYGVLLHPVGKRYSEEINGTRRSGWGDGQNRDFQETAPYRALRSGSPLAAAIEEARRAALRDPALAKAMGGDVSAGQMIFWMADLIDITLLDFIFSQQDRIGNIDYLPYWYWAENGKLQRRPASSRNPPADAANAVYVKRTELGDNDAGLRLSYTNFAKRTGMLEGLRRYRAVTYRKLMQLDRDFRAEGSLHGYVRTTFGLSDREFTQVVANTAAAADILRKSCKSGKLQFDVDPEQFLLQGSVVPEAVDCDSP
jgi:hypothetical protein